MKTPKKYHYIYKITRFDGAYYIGLHSTNNLDDGYFGSGKRIRRSVKYHGKDKHQFEIIEFVNSREELMVREAALVNLETLKDPLCMNLLSGGGENLCSSSIGDAQRGKLVSDQTRKKMSDSAKQRTDRKPHSAETRAKQSAAKLGKPKSEAHRERISAAAHRIRDEGWSLKMSEARGSACTVDGVNVFPSKRALGQALGFGKEGTRHPNFRFVSKTGNGQRLDQA